MDPDAGPDQSPPSLPTGWIAQWDSSSRKYYYVQISTGVSTWDVPTQPAPTVPTPGNTPAQPLGPYPKPNPMFGDDYSTAGEKPRGANGDLQSEGETGERGLGSMALSAMMHSNKPQQQQQQQQAGLSGLVSSFLGGSSHGGSTNTHPSSGTSSGLGQLAGSLLGGSQHKPQTQQQGSTAASGSGLSGMVGGLLGGHSSGQQQQQQAYGYSPNSQNPSGTYTGQASPPSYSEAQPQAFAASPYGPSSGAYNPQYGSQQQHNQADYSHSTPQYSQTPQASSGYGQHDQYSQHQHNQYGGAHHGHGHDQYAPQHHGGFNGGQGGPGGPPAGYNQYSSPPGKESGYGGGGGYGGPPLDQYSHHQHNQYGGAAQAHNGGGGYGGNYHGPPAPGWR